MRLYELGLQKSCYKVANRFVDEEMRLAGNRTCAILRAPWWDIVKGETPGILQRKTVMVYNKDGTELIEKRNPLRKYCFKASVCVCVCRAHLLALIRHMNTLAARKAAPGRHQR